MRSVPSPAADGATVRSYVPGGSRARANVPDDSVSTVVSRSVSRCRITITVPGAGAPAGSRTAPRITPVVVPAWAARSGACRQASSAGRTSAAAPRARRAAGANRNARRGGAGEGGMPRPARAFASCILNNTTVVRIGSMMLQHPDE